MATKKRSVDVRYESYGERRDQPIGVFATGESGRHRFMDAVDRVSKMFTRTRSRLDEVAFGRPDAVLYALALLLERTRIRHGFSVQLVDELIARSRRKRSQ